MLCNALISDMMRDILSFDYSFLLHVIGEVVHQVFLAERVEHIVAGNDIVGKYSGSFKLLINFFLWNAQPSGEVADDVCYESNICRVHSKIL